MGHSNIIVVDVTIVMKTIMVIGLLTTELEIAIGYRPFSDQFQDLADQN